MNFELLNSELDLSVRLIVGGKSYIPKERVRLRQAVVSQGYQAPSSDLGTIRDLTSHGLLNFLVNFNVFRAYGYRNWIAEIEEVALEVTPASELTLMNTPKKDRLKWIERWNAARTSLESSTRATEAAVTRKASSINAFALRTDPIWKRFSTFDLPYPPFGYDLNVSVIAVSREETVRRGLLKDSEELVAPNAINYPTPPVMGFDVDLTKCGVRLEKLFG